MSNGRFLVAEFSDGIQVIPKVWMCNNNTLCKYPSHYKSDKKIRKAVEKEEKPNSDWPLFEIKRIFGEYSSLEKADDKAERAIYTSDMDTEKETKSYRKFRARKYSYSSSISAENETFLSDVPSPSRYSSKISKFTPKKRQQQDINKDERDFPSSSENNTNFTKSTTYKSCSSNVKNRNQHENYSAALKKNRDAEDSSHTNHDTNQYEDLFKRRSSNTQSMTYKCPTDDKYSGASNKDRDEEDSINNSSHTYQLQRRNNSTWNHQSSSPIIFNQLKKLTREVTVIKYDIRQALTSIDILVQKANEETRYRITDNFLDEVENLFPLKTTIALIEMEETLSNKDSELAKKITAYIRSIGGGNVDDAVKRCLRKTFTNELAQMYNWEGRCGKNALQNLHLIKVIFRCILQNIIGSDHKQI